ncbi:GntR family transcriptional regulator [Nocardiopsis alba]|uniref:Bacterial regulatory s, gntR family protein n=1 Tax=Nocardiopsis alba (strain ATCC BAA-2165 / BE74) TaxID=1205910 RepID=J7LDS8_NOCAA|nr:GntR family transcriptional regulator [Nocardiopsis alba]AFR08672.1 bacterial regulatory s, gntR family protein [Nocardiopsis alba ATCC BAA-2165]
MSIDAPRGRSASVIGSLAENSSLRSRVTDVLRQAMVAGELEPGRIYSAPTLAERLGVSATPVREAMMELAQEGLVEPLRHRGYRVVEVGDVVLDEIIELRSLIEVPTVGRVARIATSEQVALLRPLADRLNATAAAGELQEFIATDTDFHLRLLAIAGNGRLVEEIRRLRGMSRLSALRRLYEEDRLGATAQEHHDLLDLIEAREVSGAEELMRRHLGHVRGVWAGREEA